MAKTKFAQMMEADRQKIAAAPRAVTIPLDGAKSIDFGGFIPGTEGSFFVMDSDVYVQNMDSTAMLVHPGDVVFFYVREIGFPEVRKTYKEIWEFVEPHTKNRDRPLARF